MSETSIEWSAAAVEELAKIGVPGHRLGDALRLAWRIEQRGVDFQTAVEIAALADTFLSTGKDAGA